MAETRNLLNNQTLRMDGSLGPWTLNLPAGVHGDRIRVGTLGGQPADYTLNASAGDFLRPYDGGTPTTSTTGELVQEIWTLVFDETNGREWFIVANSTLPIISSYSYGGSFAVGIAPTIVPFVFAGGDADMWTLEANGSLTSKYQFVRPVTVRTRLACALDVNGNNQGISIRADLVATGTGTVVPIYDGANNASPRAMDADAMLSPEAIWNPDVGDNLRCEVYILDVTGGATSDVNAGLQTVEIGL